jgi:hypothetical protein
MVQYIFEDFLLLLIKANEKFFVYRLLMKGGQP